MSQMERLLDLLPPSYASAGDSVLQGWLSVLSAELEAVQEDIDRVRRTHWVRLAYALDDVEKLAALVGTTRLPWETLPVFRQRLLARVKALLRGALGPLEIRDFVYDYLSGAEEALGCTFVPGLRSLGAGDAFAMPEGRPHFRPLAMVENMVVARSSAALGPHGRRVPYLYRWEEVNRGLSESLAGFAIAGLPGARTTVPVLANLTSGDLIGYADRLKAGQVLELTADPAAGTRAAAARIDGREVTGKLFSLSNFRPGVPFEPADLDPQPQLPRLLRGSNQWLFLSIGLFDVRGLNHTFFAMAGGQLRQGVFDETSFDHSLFPTDAAAHVRMTWAEQTPAAFEVRVPRYLVIEPAGPAGGHEPASRVYEPVGEALRASIGDLHAAGVRADVRFIPFVELQPQQVRVTLPWLVTEPETGPAGENDRISVGARFGESGLDHSRFE